MPVLTRLQPTVERLDIFVLIPDHSQEMLHSANGFSSLLRPRFQMDAYFTRKLPLSGSFRMGSVSGFIWNTQSVLTAIGAGKGDTQAPIQDVLADDYGLASSIVVPNIDRWWTKAGIETH